VSFEKTRVAIRGWRDGVLEFEESVSAADGELEQMLPVLAQRHARDLMADPHMIEIEFLDEADQLQRFFRFGTDPRGMARPLRVDLRPAAELN
jgi:uncharacterized protein YfcZ (UPF0381/DUF406 family)